MRKLAISLLVVFLVLISGCVQKIEEPLEATNESGIITEAGTGNETNFTQEIEQYECLNDSHCAYNQICLNKSCANLSCGYCMYPANHECLSYECCVDEDCVEGEVCETHICSAIEENFTTYNVTFELLEQPFSSRPTILGYDFPVEMDSLVIMNENSSYWCCGETGGNLGFAVIKNKDELDYVSNNIIEFADPSSGTFSDFENYFLILIFWHSISNSGTLVFTEEITASNNNINILFIRGVRERVGSDGDSLFKIKKDDLKSTKNLNFIFTEDTHERSLHWEISGVDLEEDKCPESCHPPEVSPTTGNICAYYYCNASTDYWCRRKIIKPCCGDNECDIALGENQENCLADCEGVSGFLYCESDQDCSPCCAGGSRGACMNINYSCSDYPALYPPNFCGKEVEVECPACSCVNNQCVTEGTGWFNC